MSLIKKPAEIVTRRSVIAMFYGEPGIGKTTLSLSSPNPLLFDHDDGVGRVEAKFWKDTVQNEGWDAASSLLSSPETNGYHTYIFDTVGSLLDDMNITVGAMGRANKQSNGALTQRGYGVRKQLFKSFLNDMKRASKNIIFIAHQDLETVGEDTQIVPEVGGSSGKDIIKMMDLVGYMQADGNKRIISFTPNSKFKAKNSCNLPPIISVPDILDGGSNVYATDLFEKINLEKEKKEIINKSYLELIGVFSREMENVVSSETANNFIEYVKTIEHIWDSKLQASKTFSKHCKDLKLVYDKQSGQYLEPVVPEVEEDVKPESPKPKNNDTVDVWKKWVDGSFEIGGTKSKEAVITHYSSNFPKNKKYSDLIEEYIQTKYKEDK